jgi:hypothetical protein
VVEDVRKMEDLIRSDVFEDPEHQVPVLAALVARPEAADPFDQIGAQHAEM